MRSGFNSLSPESYFFSMLGGCVCVSGIALSRLYRLTDRGD